MKKNLMTVGLISSLVFLLSGCLYGQCIDGPCALERKKYLESIKPYLHYWEKPSMTSTQQMTDSMDCGGGSRERNAPSFSSDQLRAERRSADENELLVNKRLFHAWERCMLKKGYRFTGECHDNEISRAKPACGGL